MPQGERAALATVIAVDGSSYRRPGARMLVMESGRWTGGISGGCLEGDALQKAKRAMLQNQASIVVYDTRDEDEHQIGVGLGCNGRIEILMAPIPPPLAPGNPIAVWEEILHCRRPQILVTIVSAPVGTPGPSPGVVSHWNETDAPPVEIASAPYAETLREAVARARQSGKSELISTGAYQVFIEVWTPPLHLAVFGGHYDVFPMVRLAKELGCTVSVTANLQKVNRDFIAGADLIHQQGREYPEVDAHTAIVLMSHDYVTDLSNLRRALQTDAPYIGLLGPRVRTERMCDALIVEGIPLDAHTDRIYGPAGLDIGATSPEMIALSILCEIQACFSRRTGGYLRLRQTPIYS